MITIQLKRKHSKVTTDELKIYVNVATLMKFSIIVSSFKNIRKQLIICI